MRAFDIMDELLETKVEGLSAIALNGFKEHGRGAISIFLKYRDIVDGFKVDVLTRYQPRAEWKEMDLDREFYEFLDTYDPMMCGLVGFIDTRMEGGYLQFTLAKKSKS